MIRFDDRRALRALLWGHASIELRRQLIFGDVEARQEHHQVIHQVSRFIAKVIPLGCLVGTARNQLRLLGSQAGFQGFFSYFLEEGVQAAFQQPMGVALIRGGTPGFDGGSQGGERLADLGFILHGRILYQPGEWARIFSMNTTTEESLSRTRRLLGDEGLERLTEARVAIIGLGGVGSACAESLVRTGVGSFLFADKDVVEPSNINRQAIAFLSTVGQRKVDVMEAMAKDINRAAQIDKLFAFVLEETIEEQLAPFARPDIIVDAVDTLTAKAAIARYGEAQGIPVVSAMGMANRSDPTALRFAKLFETEGCPFCRELRKIFRSRGIGDVSVLYSTERPAKVRPMEGAARSEKTELGTYSYMPPAAGLMLAGFVTQHLLKSEWAHGTTGT